MGSGIAWHGFLKGLQVGVEPSDHQVDAAWADGTLPWLLVHVAVLTALGWAVYLRGIARGMREGRLSR
jgi:hypothetical protein